MKPPVLFILALCLARSCFGQWDSLGKLEGRIMKGDKAALYALAPFLDSAGVVLERGEDDFDPTQLHGVRRIINDDCAFLPSELIIDASLTKAKFLRFLDSAGPADL